jgi:hypothetical protein
VKKLLGFVGASIGGSIGWWIGARIGFMTAFIVSMVFTGVGIYAANRIASYYGF